MNYKKMLESLEQELACVNRTLLLLTNANSGKLSAAEARQPHHPSTPDERVERLVKIGASSRAAQRQQMLVDLREERELLMRAVSTIRKLAVR